MHISRTLGAPREAVFGAFADPARLARWWGPEGFTNTFQEFDLRPGGRWRLVMHGPDGRDYANESIFTEVAAPERVSLRHVSWPRFLLTITCEDKDGRTLVGWRQTFDAEADFQKIASVAVEANEQNLDRLAAVVSESR